MTVDLDKASFDAAKLICRSKQIGEDIHTLFGADSSEVIRFENLVRRYHEEWERLGSNSGLNFPAIAFVGPNGHGKSTLVNLLIGRELPATSRIRWIGPQVPGNPHAQWEECRVVQQSEIPNLGAAYTLVDIPGIAWCTEEESMFQILLASSRLKVLVLKDSKIEAEEWQRVASVCSGSLVLPVIRMSAAETIQYPDNHDSLMERWRVENLPEIARNLSGVKVEKPVFIPELRAEGGREKHEATTIRNLESGLTTFLEKYRSQASQRHQELSASWIRFVAALEPMIRSFGGQLAAERAQELDRAIADLPRQIVEELLSDERHLKAWFRLDARADLMNRISPLAFPFRSIASLLCFTTGSWDRLIMTSTGSAPSALLTLLGGAKQKKEDDDAAKQHRRTPAFFKSVSRRKLAEPWNGFLAAMKKAGVALGSNSDPFSAVQISGANELVEIWMQEKRRAATPRGRGMAFACSLSAWLGTLIFWLLLLGPLVHTYGQYIPAAFRSLWGDWSVENFAAYPVMPASFWFTALVVSLVPCFLVALALVAWWLRKRRTRKFLDKLRVAMHSHLTDRNAGLTVSEANPQLTAYRRLTGLLTEPADSRG